MSGKNPPRINCRAINIPGGGKHLLFEVAGTSQLVGEIKVEAAEMSLLPVMAIMFSRWVEAERTRSPIELSAPRVINGNHG